MRARQAGYRGNLAIFDDLIWSEKKLENSRRFLFNLVESQE